MSENLRNYVRAIYQMDAVVHRVADDAWDNNSPCQGWTAREVVGHAAATINGVAKQARGGPPDPPPMPKDLSDPVQVWDDARENLLATLDTAWVLQRRGNFWFGEMTVDELLAATTWDPMTHAWDLATATGQPYVSDDGLVDAVSGLVWGALPTLRKFGLIGDEVEVSDDADNLSRFLAMVGRDPSSAN